MKKLSITPRVSPLTVFAAFALSALVAAAASAVTSRVDEAQLLDVGFKVLVATTPVQEKWVKSLPPGQIRSMQRNGNKFFIYPDATRKQIYVGGPLEYERYLQLHPDTQKGKQEAESRAYRSKQDDVMRKATARDESNPFLGATWGDLGW